MQGRAFSSPSLLPYYFERIVRRPLFARYLNVTTGLISQWERGEKHPQGTSHKLLSLVVKHGLGTVA